MASQNRLQRQFQEYLESQGLETSKSLELSKALASIARPQPADARAMVAQAYEQNIGALTPLVADMLNDALSEFPSEWIVEAIRAAVIANARRWSYCAKVLESWKINGYKVDRRRKPEQPGAFVPTVIYE